MGEFMTNNILIILLIGIFFGILFLMEGKGMFNVKIEDFRSKNLDSQSYLLR